MLRLSFAAVRSVLSCVSNCDRGGGVGGSRDVPRRSLASVFVLLRVCQAVMEKRWRLRLRLAVTRSMFASVAMSKDRGWNACGVL